MNFEQCKTISNNLYNWKNHQMSSLDTKTCLLVLFRPIMTHLTHSFRPVNWEAYVSSLRRSVALLFAYERISYCPWTIIHYEECLNIKVLYALYKFTRHSLKYILQFTTRIVKLVLYPSIKPQKKLTISRPKIQEGLQVLLRKEGSVTKWNLIKHEKMKYTKFTHDLCEYNNQNVFSTHREFSGSTTNSEKNDIQVVCEFICQRGDIFSAGNLQNNVAGEIQILQQKTFCQTVSIGMINCLKNRIVLKNKMLFDKITKKVVKRGATKPTSKRFLKCCYELWMLLAQDAMTSIIWSYLVHFLNPSPKNKKSHPKKIPYLLGNETFQL